MDTSQEAMDLLNKYTKLVDDLQAENNELLKTNKELLEVSNKLFKYIDMLREQLGRK